RARSRSADAGALRPWSPHRRLSPASPPRIPRRRSGGEVDATDRLSNPQGEFPQHLVSGIMPMGVVDRFEIIDVKHQNSKRLAADDSLLHESADVGFHIAAIVKPGERIRYCHFDRHLHVVAPSFRVAYLPDLSAQP